MKFFQQLMKKLSEPVIVTKNECSKCEHIGETESSQPEWHVQRYKDGHWTQFGVAHPNIDMAVSAMIDWQHMFVGTQFRVAKGMK